MTLIRLTAVAVSILFVSAACCADDVFSATIEPLIRSHCFQCHGQDDEVNGELDFRTFLFVDSIETAYESWESVAGVIADGTMPPEDQPQLSTDQRDAVADWYQRRFVRSVDAHPGFFRPRRLSATEYRNTLRSVLGFDLEVNIREAEQTITQRSLVLKLLPTDPPGPSGFENDTSANPLSTVAWDQYSYLADTGLEQLFSPSRRRELQRHIGEPEDALLNVAQAERLLRRFARLTRRRSVAADDPQLAVAVSAIRGLKGQPLQDAVVVQLKTMLMSPTFLYRGLLMSGGKDRQRPVDGYELAERLSYFLWGDMPDEELWAAAKSGDLMSDDQVRRQVQRMLADPKARRLSEDLAVQWFSLGEIENVTDRVTLRDSLMSQPIDFMNYLFVAGRPLTELVDSEITFANTHTAKFYPGDRKKLPVYKRKKGIEAESLPNAMIRLTNSPGRGGLLTMPGVLAMNRGPVIRGTWILERILGEHLPDPPADVGQVQPNRRGEKLTFRQRFEQHRSNQTCALCHDKIDPLGFALEAYDQTGMLRQNGESSGNKPKSKKSADDDLAMPIDTSGRLPTGETFQDFDQLKQILVTSQKERLIRTIVRRMLSYALCRKLALHDQPTVESLVADLVADNGTFHDLIHRITTSLPFRQTVVRSGAE